MLRRRRARPVETFFRPARPPRAGAVMIMPVILLSVGCQRVLFEQNEPRTQFETYERMRQQHVAPEEPDVFGNPQPALRARLSS